MTSVLTHIVPANAWFAPPREALETARDFIMRDIFRAVEAKPDPLSDAPSFYCGPEMGFLAVCPSCHAEHREDQFYEILMPAYDSIDLKAQTVRYPMPCCAAVVNLTDFEFPFPNHVPFDDPKRRLYQAAAFARTDLCLWDFDRLFTDREHDQLTILFTCPIKTIWYPI